MSVITDTSGITGSGEPAGPEPPGPEPPVPPEGAQVPAADQTLRILSFLARQPGPVPAAVICAAVGIPRSTGYHLLATLRQRGFVTHLPDRRRWGLGLAAFELAGGFARQEPLARLGRHLVARLADQVGESAHLAVMSGRDVLYLVDERAPRRPALVTEVGVRLPAHLTATGRAMLAAVPAAQVRALFPDASAFADRTGRGPARLSELRAILRQVRTDGYATEDGEVTLGLGSVGVAVLDHTGWPAAALAVTYPQQQVPSQGLARWVRLLSEAATELSRRIGGH